MCTHQPVLYPGCSRKEVLEPSATTTPLIHEDWQTLISFRESMIGMHQARVKNTVVGSPSVVIQAKGYLTTCYASGCETRDHLFQVPRKRAYSLLVTKKRYCESSYAVWEREFADLPFRCIRFEGRCCDLCNRMACIHITAEVCRHSKPNPQLERIRVTGFGTVATCETWCVLWVGWLYVTWDNNCYNTHVRIPTILTITLWWSRDARKISSNLNSFLEALTLERCRVYSGNKLCACNLRTSEFLVYSVAVIHSKYFNL